MKFTFLSMAIMQPLGLAATSLLPRRLFDFQAPGPRSFALATSTILVLWPLGRISKVTDTRPPSRRTNYTDPSQIEKFTLPASDYEARSDTVLAWKKAQKLGRFDPNAPTIEDRHAVLIAEHEAEIAARDINIGKRCRLLPQESDDRRGEVAFVGEVKSLPGEGLWVGVRLDEPVGKNDGTVKGERVFECQKNCGVFVRPERVDVGEYGVRNLDDDLDEI